MISASGNTATAHSAGRSIDETIVTDSAGKSARRNGSPCRSHSATVPWATMIGAILRVLGNVPLGLQVANRLDRLAPLVDGLPGRFVGPAQRLRPGGDADALGGGFRLGQPAHRGQAVQALPDLFGHERHDRMEQRQSPSSSAASTRWATGRAVGIAQAAFDELEVPVAEVAPGEVAQLAGRLGELELLEGRCHFADRSIQAVDDPAILDRQLIRA